MLLKSLGIILALCASCLVYLHHPNQSLLKQPLPHYAATLGWVVYIVALLILLYTLPKLVAVFLWLAVLIAVWSFAPFISLFKRYNPSEN